MGANQPWNVLEESPRRTERFGDANDLPEEAGAVPAEPDPFAGDTEVLAWESPHEKINGAESPLPVRPLWALSGWLTVSGAPRPFRATRGSNIIGSGDVGPAPFEDLAAEGVDFDLESTLEASSFKSKIKPPDPREQ